MRLFLCLALLSAATAGAWDTIPHQRITRAALQALPRSCLARFAAENGPLIRIYSLLPDLYQEMERFGFIRNSPGRRSPEEIRIFCVRPDGVPVHGASGDRETDIASVVYLLEGTTIALAAHRPREASRFAGVLSHFVADTLSPPHAAEEACEPAIHAAIERSIPEFRLADRPAAPAGANLVDAAQATVDRCYRAAEGNRRDLPAMVKAARARDKRSLDVYRLRAAKEAADILARALVTVCDCSAGREVR